MRVAVNDDSANDTKRQIYSFSHGFLGFGNLVEPIVLGCSAHQEKAAVSELNCLS